MSKAKVVIVFPKYDRDDNSHYPYWYRVFEEAGKKLSLKVFFETGKGEINLENCETYRQRWQVKPLNLLERFVYFVYLRCQGYQKFYVHYSLFSFFIAYLVTRLCGGEVYLWDCEYYEKLPQNKLLVRAWRWTDFLVTGHKKIAKQYQKILGEKYKKMKVVTSWVTDDLMPKSNKAIIKTKSNKFDILFVHDLSWRKGSRDLPEIIELVLRSTKRKTSFTIVGAGPDYQYLKQWLMSKSFASQISLTGALTLRQTLRKFSEANLFILPSRAEGFPRVILEALHFGVPFIATDVGCVKEITPLELRPFIVAAGDIASFNQRIKKMMHLSSARIEKVRAAQIMLAMKFKLSLAAQEFINIFD